MKRALIRFAVPVLLVAASAVAGFYLYQYTGGMQSAPESASAEPAVPASGEARAGSDAMVGLERPGFSLPDLQGRERHIGEWDGQVLVVNFWATWCPPCLKEIPDFVELQSEYGGKGLQFIGIALQKPADVVDFAREHGMNYPVLAGEMPVIQIAEAYGNNIGALPYTVVVDRKGKIVFTRQGPILGPEMESIIRPLL